MRLVLLVSRDQFRVAYESMISANVWGVYVLVITDYCLLNRKFGMTSGGCPDAVLTSLCPKM